MTVPDLRKVPYGVDLEEMVELSRWRLKTGHAGGGRQLRSRVQGTMCLAPVENSRLPVFWKQRVTIWKGS